MRLMTGLLLGFTVVMGGVLWAADTTVESGDYPTRAVTIVVPWAPGGPSDTIARILASHMSSRLGQPVVVENIVGSGGISASLRVKGATPDGYTLLVGNMGTHGAAPALYSKLGYNPRADFEPIGILVTAPIVILGRKDFPADDLKEFALYVQANSHRLDEGHGGVGSIPFTACLLLNHLLHARPRLVPYDGAAPSIQALIRGRIDYMCDQVINAAPHVRAGRVKAYGIAAPERSPALPDVPTTREGGLPEYQLSAWQAMFAPKGVPRVVVERIHNALSRALEDETVRNRLLAVGSNIPDRERRTPQALAELVREEMDRWASIVRLEGFNPN